MPQLLLDVPDSQVDNRDQTILSLREQLRRANEDLLTERRKNAGVEAGVGELRQTLSPIYHAFQQVFGMIEDIGIGEVAATGTTKSNAAWDSWKQKLGSNSAAAKIIEILMVHGELTHTQLRIHIGTSRMQTVYDAVSKLNKAALLNKNGDKFSLKEL